MQYKYNQKINPVPLSFTCYEPVRRKKPLCCTVILDESTQLVPPAVKGSTCVEKILFAEIEKVCDCVVVICGKVKKIIHYTIIRDGIAIPNTIIDEVPFQCLIEDDQARAGDKYEVTQKKILCEVDKEELNFGKDLNGDVTLAFRLREKDIIKVCVKRKKEKRCNQYKL